MLLLFMEKEVHKPRCIPGASCIFRLLFIWFDADKVMPFGRRRVEPCGNKAAFLWSPAEALLPQAHGQKAVLAQPVPRPTAEGSTAPGGGTSQPAPHRSLGWGQPFGKPEGSSAGLWRGSAGKPVLRASRGDPCVSNRGQRLSTRQGDFCIWGTFYNRACTLLRFLSWKALKFLPVWLILSLTCSAHRKIAMIFFFLVKVSFSRICWAKAKLMFFVRKLRFVPKHRTAGTGPSEGHQKLHFPPGQCGCSCTYYLHLARKLFHS